MAPWLGRFLALWERKGVGAFPLGTKHLIIVIVMLVVNIA